MKIFRKKKRLKIHYVHIFFFEFASSCYPGNTSKAVDFYSLCQLLQGAQSGDDFVSKYTTVCLIGTYAYFLAGDGSYAIWPLLVVPFALDSRKQTIFLELCSRSGFVARAHGHQVKLLRNPCLTVITVVCRFQDALQPSCDVTVLKEVMLLNSCLHMLNYLTCKPLILYYVHLLAEYFSEKMRPLDYIHSWKSQHLVITRI